jgi:hypothetical protein
VLTGQARSQPFKELAHLVSLAKARSIELLHENSQPVDGLDQTQPLEFKKRFPYRTLGNSQLFGQALLGKPLARLAFARKDAALDLFSNLVPANRRLHDHNVQILHSPKTSVWSIGAFSARCAVQPDDAINIESIKIDC